MKHFLVVLGFAGAAVVALLLLQQNTVVAQKKAGDAKKKAMIGHGKYLVIFGGCDDCHSPKVFGPMGPMPDTTRLLSGHPADSKLAEVPQGLIAPDKWGALTTNDLTAWVGPWGTSFSRNLTPDVETGIGSWNEAMFIKTLRTGKHMGEGRNLLPPMPWQGIGQLNDKDLKDIFAYLSSLKPIENAVPDPIAPTGERIATPTKPESK
jgi:mono/diheme cytochrome c family protein